MDDFASFRQSSYWQQVRQLMARVYGNAILDLAKADPDSASEIVTRHREAAGMEKMLREVIATVEQREITAQDDSAKITDIRKFVYDQIKGA